MSDLTEQDMNDILALEKAREVEEKVLNRFLGNLRAQANHHFALQIHMGEIPSYLTSVPLKWIAKEVGFADDLPIFKKRESTDGSRKISWDSETMDLIQQRRPNWDRQLAMSAYLAIRRHHKFPPLLLVGYQSWVYDKQHENWGDNGRAANHSLTLTELESTGTYWDLDSTGTQFYALDGQHRLMAFKGLRDLIDNGQLPALDRNGRPRRSGGLSRDDVIKYINQETGESTSDIHARLQSLMSEERIGIEIIPAVCRNEDYTQALRRLRQVFVDVNENAKPLTKAQIAQLDEANGFRIIARRLCVEHELFKSSTTESGEIRLKVDPEKDQLSEKSDCYTALHTLAETVKRYLTENKKLPSSQNYASWNSFLDRNISVRPADDFLEHATQAMMEYFNNLKRLPSHTAFIQGRPGGELRKSGGGEDNILFRPIIQTALAEALGKLATRGVPLESAIEKLVRAENFGQLKLTERTAPWFGVASNFEGKMRRDKKSEDLCCRMFRYLLGGGFQDNHEREALRDDFAEARQIDPDNEQAINLEDKQVNTEEVRLPDPWQ